MALEATGVYWKPVWHILGDEESLTLVLANARRIRNVPGRRSDQKDAAWIADLLAHGLIEGSFVPPAPIQELRDLTRTRKQLVAEIARHTQRLQKTLELQYMSEPKLRAKVRRGLLEVEQLHALARAVYYGQRGRISAREVYDQMNACSCLTLILACIVYWQAREISRLAAAPDFPFDPDLLRHVSPIEWKNVVVNGEIKIDPAKLKVRGGP